MMNIITAIFTSVLIFLNVHPLHVSVTEIEYDEKDRALETTIRVFIDDMELTLRKNLHQPELDILNPEAGTTDQLLQAYLAKHFNIMLDNKQQKLNYLGHEVDGDAFVLYVEVSNVRKWKTIHVRNDMLMEMYKDQSSLINVTVKGNVKSLRLTPALPVDKLTF